MKKNSTFFALPFLVLLSACASHPVEKVVQPFTQSAPCTESESHPLQTFLTHEEASIRAKQVAHTTYALWFGLDAQNEDFEARTVINFELRAKAREHSKTLFLDFSEGKIRTLIVNGSAASPSYDGQRIYFNTKDLLLGTNRIEIAFTHSYSKDGNGFHRFKDPVDQQVYLYTHLEPFAAHRIFPCFDQPDLKASFELSVDTPQDWQVVANTLEKETPKVDGRRSWTFPPSPSFSPYLFALHAGPFSSWKSISNGIATRLFARKSVASWVDSPEWFEITGQGLDYFSTQFGYPFPYSKYDQILVPDFNAGAMENVGAVTFSERYLFRTAVTQDRRRERANTILHEMAHMWFGDLVTMKWWNGLWLNESFASYMASKAVEEVTRFKGEWQNFHSGMKQWAYWEDQTLVTHPIEVAIPSTDQAKANFDGITYGKGAAVDRQLAHYLGEDDFREGVQRYFQKYALRNTTISDFMKMLSEASSKDLAPWQKAWFLTSGVNTVEAKWSCENSKITQFSLLQGQGEAPTGPLRPHRTKIALFHLNKKNQLELQSSDTLDATYFQAETAVPQMLGKTCPDLVFPNYLDMDYVKVLLDPSSLDMAKKNLSRLSDAFARQMIWSSLWQMVLDARLKAQDYADLVLLHGLKETDTQVLRRLLNTLIRHTPGEESVLKFLPENSRAAFRKKIEPLYLKKLQLAPAASDLQLIWFDAWLEAARSPESVLYLERLLSGKAKLRGLVMDQERRWKILNALAAAGESNAPPLIASEKAKDQSDLGIRLAMSAEASIPTPENKKLWLDKILQTLNSTQNTDVLSLAQTRAAIHSFEDLEHEDLIRLLIEPYFASLAQFALPANLELTHSFVGGLYPSLCDPSIGARTREYLKAHPDLPAMAIKSLQIHQQEDDRCFKARTLAQEGSKAADGKAN